MNGPMDSMNANLLYKGCEAFWRDVKYAVMARNYQYVKDLSAELKRAQGDMNALYAWVYRVKCVEQMPMAESALRNTVYHLLGYWKRELDSDERRQLSDSAAQSPDAVLADLKVRVASLPNSYLQSAYIWRNEPWVGAVFRSGGTAFLFCVQADEALKNDDPTLLNVQIHRHVETSGGEVG